MKNKSFIKHISAVAITIMVLIFSTQWCIQLFFPEPTIIQAVQSPDGKYTAYVYESNGGATTDFIYHLSILETGRVLSKGNGNTYISKYLFDVTWSTDRTLHVNNTTTIMSKQRESIKDIKVTYNYLKE